MTPIPFAAILEAPSFDHLMHGREIVHRRLEFADRLRKPFDLGPQRPSRWRIRSDGQVVQRHVEPLGELEHVRPGLKLEALDQVKSDRMMGPCVSVLPGPEVGVVIHGDHPAARRRPYAPRRRRRPPSCP